MKKLFFAIVIALCFSACNKIEEPYLTQSQQEEVNVVFPDLDYKTVYRRILFDEYTGHTCTNCPSAHDKVTQLLTQYKDTLVAVCIHAGDLAQTYDGLFSYDFTTEVGNQLYNDFGITAYPIAIINRSGSPITKPQWDSELGNADTTVYSAIQIINQYDATHQKLKVNTKTTMLRDYAQPVQLSLLLVEDNVVKPQTLPGVDNVDTFYVHNHVLRAGINGTYGEYISPNGLLEKDSAYLYGYTIDFNGKDWDPNHCSVIAILLDKNDKSVLQVGKSKVR